MAKVCFFSANRSLGECTVYSAHLNTHELLRRAGNISSVGDHVRSEMMQTGSLCPESYCLLKRPSTVRECNT